jgi:hypothetical protein
MPKTIKKIHLRVAIGAAILMVALLIWIFQIDAATSGAGVTR